MAALLPYQAAQVGVYSALLLQRQQADPDFTFSLRRKFGDDDAATFRRSHGGGRGLRGAGTARR